MREWQAATLQDTIKLRPASHFPDLRPAGRFLTFNQECLNTTSVFALPDALSVPIRGKKTAIHSRTKGFLGSKFQPSTVVACWGFSGLCIVLLTIPAILSDRRLGCWTSWPAMSYGGSELFSSYCLKPSFTGQGFQASKSLVCCKRRQCSFTSPEPRETVGQP